MAVPIVGSPNVFKWTNDYLFQVLTGGRDPLLKDPKIIAAFRKIDRKDFVPYQIKEKAYNDLEIDIGYNETLTRPTIIAQMMSLLKPKYGGTYLDIGSGTGYFAVILSMIAGEGGKVYSLERVQWLWEQSRRNATKYKDESKSLSLLYRDGITGLPNQAPFDGIHIAFALDVVPEPLKQQLKIGGRLICPTTQMDLRVVDRTDGTEFIEEIVPGFKFTEGKNGTA